MPLQPSLHEGETPCPCDRWCVDPECSEGNSNGTSKMHVKPDRSTGTSPGGSKEKNAPSLDDGPSSRGSHPGMNLHSTLENEALRGMTELSYSKWCALLIPMVLKTRTAFSAFLATTIQLSQRTTGRGPLAPTFYPIPLPPATVFRMPAGCSAKRRRGIHLSKAVHTVCMALNFWFHGGSAIEPSLLQREPNLQHRCLFRRIGALIKSDGPMSTFMVPKMGRKFPELIAQLNRISQLFTNLGTAGDPYDRVFPGMEMPSKTDLDEEVQPYTDLCPERLVFHGSGQWEIDEFLPDDLAMAFREPRTLISGKPTPIKPILRDPPERVAELAKKWDQHSLLYIHSQGVPSEGLVRIFNARKSAVQDRQIGDKRGQNGLESKILGPSACLPNGIDIADLCVDPSWQYLAVSISDRRDFCHQLKISPEKALGNTIGPAVPISLVEETTAYALWAAQKKDRQRYHRLRHGDMLAEPVDGGLLVPPPDHVWIAFNSVLQGDHVGVEVATAAHTSLLQKYGLLDDLSQLIASRPLRSSGMCQGLVIDDFFAVSVESLKTPPAESQSAKAFKSAQDAYQKHGVLGSPDKDICGETSGKTIGAFVNSSPHCTKHGMITIGAPTGKRLGLSFITLMLCRMPCTTDVLHACLVGGWVALMTYRRPCMSILDFAFRLVDSQSINHNCPKVIRLPRKNRWGTYSPFSSRASYADRHGSTTFTFRVLHRRFQHKGSYLPSTNLVGESGNLVEGQPIQGSIYTIVVACRNHPEATRRTRRKRRR